MNKRAEAHYIKVKGQRMYLYRAVDRGGQTLDFMLSDKRNKAVARRFFKAEISVNGVPDRIVIDKSGANLAGLQADNVIQKFQGNGDLIGIVLAKYLNNIIEQDHRFIKRITRPMMGFKALHSAAATLAGIETAHMIRKGQIFTSGATGFQKFMDLAALIRPASTYYWPQKKFAAEPVSANRWGTNSLTTKKCWR